MMIFGFVCFMIIGVEVEVVLGEGFCWVLLLGIGIVGVMVNMFDSVVFGKVFSVLFVNV